jgi:large subunit ribosomal protein L24
MSSQSVTKIRLKKDDLVVVLSGKDKGKTGKIVATHPKLNKVTVDGINLIKRHTKANKRHPQGGIIESFAPIAVSKVAIYDSTNKKPARIKYSFDKEGNKVRLFHSTGKEIK